MSFIIRRMTKDDVDAVFEIEKISFKDPWSRESIEYEMVKNSVAVYFVGIETKRAFGQDAQRDKIVAYGGMWAILNEGHITNIAVHPEYQRQKKGLLLMSKIIEEAGTFGIRHFTLEVKTTNTAAIALYEKLGFRVEGTRRKYYQYDGSDAYIMWKRGE